MARASGSLPWTTDDAAELYLIDRWGAGYFGVSDDGKMEVTPLPGRPGSVAILRFPGTVAAGAYPQPRSFGGMGKPVDPDGYSDHFPIGTTVTETD